jgi:hypothetical protein
MMNGYMRSFLAFILASTLIGLAIQSGAASRIYKTVDENGNVVFTDIPPKDGDQANPIAVETPNTFQTSPSGEDRQEWIVDPTDEDEAETSFSYRSLAITTPANNASVRENAGNVNIMARVDPELRIGHKIRIVLDGSPEQAGAQNAFILPNVDRGTHTLVAEVIDDAGNVVISSPPTTFHLQRVSAPRPTPARAN